MALDREAVMLLEGLANGVFGAEARKTCSGVFQEWMKILASSAGFIEQQRTQWRNALLSKPVPPSNSRYPTLKEYSHTWPDLEISENRVRLYGVTAEYFRAIFSGEVVVSPSIIENVDKTLDTLVTKFDDEELPARRDERLQMLIIEEGGDAAVARSRASLESEALAEKVSFTQLLTNAAMHPETSHATKATQRFAIAMTRDWIVDAHNDIVAVNRNKVPAHIDIALEGWSGTTRDGSNEEELLNSVNSEFQRRVELLQANIKIGVPEYVIGVASALGALYGLMSLQSAGALFLLLSLGAGAWVWMQYSTLTARRLKAQGKIESLRDNVVQIVKAALAEVVDWRREYALEDKKAASVNQLLEAISPDQYMLKSHDAGRAVVIR